MKISILSFDLSDNGLVRVYPIAKVLERKHTVEVVGPQFGPGVYDPYKGLLAYKAFPVRGMAARFPAFCSTIVRIAKALDGDIIYVFKPRVTSLAPALLSQIWRRRPVILDIEDWEAGPLKQSGLKGIVRSLRYLHHPLGEIHTIYAEWLSSFSDVRTVVSSFLQERFGGKILVHGADTSVFDPQRYTNRDARDALGLDHKLTYILFAGMVRPHKGVGDLLKALASIGTSSYRLLVVGPRTSTLERYLEDYPQLLVYRTTLPHDAMPLLLSASDIVALPQRDEASARAQVPGKVFEAMAMGKPILATGVSDLPKIVGDGGWIVPPNAPDSIAEVLSLLLVQRPEMIERGLFARERCVQNYSWDAMERTLEEVIKGLVE